MCISTYAIISMIKLRMYLTDMTFVFACDTSYSLYANTIITYQLYYIMLIYVATWEPQAGYDLTQFHLSWNLLWS